jgi:RNA polymerase sigma-70 factor, ECF subfamily
MIARNLHLQNDPELIADVNVGNKEAFAAIYRAHFSGLCDFTYYITQDAEVAKELVQDTFMAIWEQRRTWSPHSTIRSYLYKAVKNRSLDFLKHQKVVRKYEQNNQNSESDDRNQDDQISQRELATAIDKEIERLPEKCRIIFIMSRQQGLTYNEIAEVQGVSIKTVETQIGRALKKLRTSLRHFI